MNSKAWVRQYNNTVEILDTFSHFFEVIESKKKLVSGNNWVGPASVLLAVWIDGRSILGAGDNHSVSASSNPNSYLCLPTASMPQMTQRHAFFFIVPKTQRGESVFTHTQLCFCRLVRLHPPLNEHNSPEVHLHHRSTSTKPTFLFWKVHVLMIKQCFWMFSSHPFCLLPFEMNYALSEVSGDKLFFFIRVLAAKPSTVTCQQYRVSFWLCPRSL